MHASSPLRIAFMGTPDFSVPALKALNDAGHEVIAVYTQPPRPAGRGQAPRPGPVARYATEAGIPVFTPVSLKGAEEQARFAALAPDVAVVVAYGLILPQAVLDVPPLGCLNLHASLLPRWRGAAPIQRAIWAGDEETGVAVMKMEAGLDTGPVLAVRRTPISAEDTAGTLHDRLAAMGAELLIETLPRWAAGEIVPQPQPEEGVTYAEKIGKEEGRIDWRQPAEAVSRQIRALSPWPGAYTFVEGERLKVLAARPEQGAAGAVPGRVLDDELLIACGEGALRLLRVQRPGKRPMAAAEMLRGRPVAAGTRLG